VPDGHADATPLPADDTMFRMPDVERMTGVKKSTIKRMVAAGTFPKPLRIGMRARGWLARDVKCETLSEQQRRPRQ
jgi:prophage regulatory protein